ncbi:MAG: DAK2 domain-containing protein [Limnochordia bacterium]|nr:DAK2 domain-containing protein [Limnochordia bacterium]MDD2629151.1 DAK2 domain-containing protein [Limnochordia bacterium]
MEGKLTGAQFRKLLYAAIIALAEHKDEINALNIFPVPDGDTGTNMFLTLYAAGLEVEKVTTNVLFEVAQIAARGALMGARGNSGVILSQLIRGFANGLGRKQHADPNDLALALISASRQAQQAVMKPVEGTMLTVARSMAQEARQNAKAGDVLDFAKLTCRAAEDALARTPEQLPVLKQAGVVDAGGKGIVVICQGALGAWDSEQELDLGILKGVTASDESAKAKSLDIPTITEEDIVGKYCTELLLYGQGIDEKRVRKVLMEYGDSLMVVGDGRAFKIHIHTDYPGKVLNYCGLLGDMRGIKIDNMVEQNQNLIQRANGTTPKKKTGVVAVAVGEGFEEIFRSLGADEVVSGGQTMNPATEDLMEAVNRVEAESVVILPNNKNIIATAKQVAELVERPIEVVPSRTVPEGIISMINYDPSEDAKANRGNLESVIKQIKNGEVTYAVRGLEVDGFSVSENDIIGLWNGKLSAVGSEVNNTLLDLIDAMLDEDDELVSVYYGSDVTKEKAEEIYKSISSKYPDLEIELYYGGQPLYYYLVAIE